MANTLFSEAQNAHIRQLGDKAAALSAQLVACLSEAGKTLDGYLVDHVVEDLAKRVVLAPLKRDADTLVALLLQLRTRLRMCAPPMTAEEYDGAVALQLKDVREAARPSAAAVHSRTERELEHIVSQSYVALTSGCAAMEEALHTMDHGRQSNGALSAAAASLVDALKQAAKKSTDVADAIAAWRRQQADRGAHQ